MVIRKRLSFILISFLCGYSASLVAAPKSIKVIFLARPDSQVFIKSYINSLFTPLFSEEYAQMDISNRAECIPYGEGCFHPQYGYIESEEKAYKRPITDKDVELRTINATNTNLIECDENHYFDMFCGKEQKKEKKKASSSKAQLWIDISSSMKTVDYSKDEGFCERRRLVSKLESHCKDKLDIFTFNTTRQRVGSLENSCLYFGTNNGDKLAKWLEQSEATEVVIVTDVDEYKGPFREYLDGAGAEIVGIGVQPFYAVNLNEYFEKLKIVCK